MNSEEFSSFIMGIVFGIILTFMVFLIVGMFFEPIWLTRETGNDICHKITGNNQSTSEGIGGKIQCVIPSYDSTQNIIIKINNGSG